MNSIYYRGALNQLEERLHQLIEQIPSNHFEMELLEQRCRRELEDELNFCRELRDSPKFLNPAAAAQRLDCYRDSIANVQLLGSIAVPALVRATDDDLRMNRLMKRIVKEIKFPLMRPVVSCTSQQHYRVYPTWNLVFVPFLESQQLLHLPDLYHELGHIVLAETSDRRVEPFKLAVKESKAQLCLHLSNLLSRLSLGRIPKHLKDQLVFWNYCWSNPWVVEFFCDLFAVFAVGPSFVWAHLHLCAKFPTTLFELPSLTRFSHPAPAARFAIAMDALRLLGYSAELKAIQAQWDRLLATTGEESPSEFDWCYPREALQRMVESAFEAYIKMGCEAASPNSSGAVASTLSEAWTRFWDDSESYAAWEARTVTGLQDVRD